MPLIKRSLSLHGHRTSLALEPDFWQIIDGASAFRNISLARLIAEIDDSRDPNEALSSSVRVWALRQALLTAGQRDE